MRVRSKGRLYLIGLLLACGAACTSSVPTLVLDVSPSRWEREVRARGLDPAQVPMALAATPEMKAFARETAGLGSDDERVERLHQALLDRSAFGFEYETFATFTAAEAFAARRGNCVSLSNLLVSLARVVGVPMRAALYRRGAPAEKSGDLVVSFAHMVAVQKKMNGVRLYDFYRERLGVSGELRLLDDLEVVAVAESNAGVEQLRAGALDEAREHLERALKLGPTLPDTYANLGIVLGRQGQVEAAFAAYRKGLELSPYAPNLLSNLASLHLAQGRTQEARTALAAANLDEASPFFLVAKGDLELAAGDAASALRSYRRARRRDPRLVEPLLGIARSEIVRGRPAAARAALDTAARLAPGDGRIEALRATF